MTRRIVVAALGGVLGIVVWSIVWFGFVDPMARIQPTKLLLLSFVASVVIGGASGVLLGEALHIVPTQELVDDQMRPLSVFSSTSSPVPAPRELGPGNFYSFEFYIDLPLGGATHIGSPSVCTRDTSTGRIRWGVDSEWFIPTPDQTRASWVDDPKQGLGSKTISRPEDVIGALGDVGDMRLVFESILDPGKNVIVYSLYCRDKQIRLAYSWPRQIFERAPSSKPR